MLDRIQASLTALPPAEQRVGKLVLADARKFVNLPISEIADRSHVSKPTVVRFCRSMGYDGQRRGGRSAPAWPRAALPGPGNSRMR